MNNIDQTRLARLRPEKLDDMAVKEQLSVVNYINFFYEKIVSFV
jgi:hypothetical protein